MFVCFSKYLLLYCLVQCTLPPYFSHDSKWCLLILIYRCDWNGLDAGIACLVICTLSQHSCGITTVQWVSLAHHYKPNCWSDVQSVFTSAHNSKWWSQFKTRTFTDSKNSQGEYFINTDWCIWLEKIRNKTAARMDPLESSNYPLDYVINKEKIALKSWMLTILLTYENCWWEFMKRMALTFSYSLMVFNFLQT